jgi:hypothetical protein
MGYLVDVLIHAYRVLGFEQAVSGDAVSGQLVLALPRFAKESWRQHFAVRARRTGQSCSPLRPVPSSWGSTGAAPLRRTPAEGSGPHRIAIGGDAGSFTDPDGFEWEAAAGSR